MILAFDTSTAACTAALFDENGGCIGRADERIGRGHSERLMPMLAELLGGRAASRIIVGVGPGSFTGIRVGIAAAHGLAIGWGAELEGMSSLALIAAGAELARLDIPHDEAVLWMVLFAIATTAGIVVLEVLAIRSPGTAASRLTRIRSYVDNHRDSVINWAYLLGGLFLLYRALIGLF